MPGSIRTILPKEAETITNRIAEMFSKKEHLYYAIVINARGEFLSACLPDNRTLCCIESQSALSFSVCSLYDFFRNGCKTILKNDKVFFLPIKERETLIGGIGFYTNDFVLRDDAAAIIIEYLQNTEKFFN
jgi:hypothetical protein